MSICKGRNVNNTYRYKFYNALNEETKEWYFKELGCKNQVISNELCGLCLQKDVSSTLVIKENKLKDKSGKRIWQPRVLHGKIGSAVPVWSQIENGEWYQSMLKKGFRKESDKMSEKKVSDEIKTKTKPTSKRIYKKKEVSQLDSSNVVIELQPKLYVDNSVKDVAIEVVKVEVKLVKINDVQYYYDSKKNKVYTTDFTYVGRYDTKSETLFTEYPDSDLEPEF